MVWFQYLLGQAFSVWDQKRGAGPGKRLYDPSWFRNESMPCLGTPNHSVCALSQGGSPGSSTPGEKGPQVSSLHLRLLPEDGKLPTSLESSFGAEKRPEMCPRLPPSLFAICVNMINKFFGRAMELSEAVLCFLLPRLGSSNSASASKELGLLVCATMSGLWHVLDFFEIVSCSPGQSWSWDDPPA